MTGESIGRPLTEDSSRATLAPPLIERGREVAAMAAAVDSAAAGEGSVVVVEGEAGTGKTRLLAEGRLIASERAIAALSSSGAELEQSFPFGVMRQLLERPIFALDEVARRELRPSSATRPTRARRARRPRRSS